jgi:hypothetical protein
LKELDRLDGLLKREFLLDWMLAGDRSAASTNPGERRMRPKRPLVGLLEDVKKCCAQRRQLLGDGTFHPHQAGPFRLRTVADTSELQGKGDKPIGYQPKLLDGFGYGRLLPRRHEREVDVGGGHRPHRPMLQAMDKPRELPCDFRRNLQAHEDARSFSR